MMHGIFLFMVERLKKIIRNNKHMLVGNTKVIYKDIKASCRATVDHGRSKEIYSPHLNNIKV